MNPALAKYYGRKKRISAKDGYRNRGVFFETAEHNITEQIEIKDDYMHPEKYLLTKNKDLPN